MKKILVTGHRGFLGSAFCERYRGAYDIVGYDLAEGDDLGDYTRLVERSRGCECIVHLAAIPKPVLGKTFEEYVETNVSGTLSVARAAVENGVKRVVYASSTTIYGIERGIPFRMPIREDNAFVSQYLASDDLACRDIDLSYHMSKVMAEQVMAWYGLTKKVETVALRFGPINKVFLGTSVSLENATRAIHLAVDCEKSLWYEPLTIVDPIEHFDLSRARDVIGYVPEVPHYASEQIHSGIDSRYTHPR